MIALSWNRKRKIRATDPYLIPRRKPYPVSLLQNIGAVLMPLPEDKVCPLDRGQSTTTHQRGGELEKNPAPHTKICGT